MVLTTNGPHSGAQIDSSFTVEEVQRTTKAAMDAAFAVATKTE